MNNEKKLKIAYIVLLTVTLIASIFILLAIIFIGDTQRNYEEIGFYRGQIHKSLEQIKIIENSGSQKNCNDYPKEKLIEMAMYKGYTLYIIESELKDAYYFCMY